MAAQELSLGSFRESSDPGVFKELQGPSVTLASWKRKLPVGVQRQLTDWAMLESSRIDSVVPALSPASGIRGCGIPSELEAWITADIETLAMYFLALAPAKALRVALGVHRTDHCRKFHVDYLPLRLVCTYYGPGTQWVPDASVNRAAMASSSNCPVEANTQIVPDAMQVRHAGAGDVLMMKGASWPESRGQVHRSPPIEAEGSARVVLIVNAAQPL